MKTLNTNLIFLLAASGLTSASASCRAQSRAAQLTAPIPSRSAAPENAMDSVTGIVHSRLLRSGVPMGGIGAGTFQLRTDGTVGQSAVGDDPARLRAPSPGCFLALWTRAQSRASARVLALQSGYGLPTVSRLDYDGLYPQANLAFPEVSPSVQAALLAFSPLVPFDLRNSSFPAAVFILRLKNTTTAPVEVSGLLSWESLLPLTDANARMGHAAMIFPSVQGFFGAHLGSAGNLQMPDMPVAAASNPDVRNTSVSNASRPADTSPTQPQMTVAAYPQRPQAIVTTALWDATDARPVWWDAFARDGDVPDGKANQAAQFARPAACVSVRLTLKPGEAVELPFAVSWYMPRPPALPISKRGQDSADNGVPAYPIPARNGDNAGRYYQVAFGSADDAAMQLLEDWRSLYGLTEEWQKRLLFSNLPRWMARRLINAAAPLSTHAVHTRDGRFAFLDTVRSDTAGDDRATRLSNAAPAATPGVAAASSDVADALQSERDATFAHQSADALLLALFPQLAAQELRQFAAMQDADGFVAPPAGADWAARLGPPLTLGGPLIPDVPNLFVLPDLGRPASGASEGAKPNTAPADAAPRGRGKAPAATPSLRPANKIAPPDAAAPGGPPSALATLDPIDATSAYVLQTTRFLAWTGDADDVKRFYPSAQRAVSALLKQKEETLAPLPPAALTLRLAALKAGQRLARLADDEAFAKQCEAGARQGSMDMEARLWNGEFYQTAPRMVSNPAKVSKTAPLVPGPDAICASDQLWGQWLAYQLDLGPLLPPDHLLRAAQSVQRRNDLASDAPLPTTPPLSLLPAPGALLPPWHVRTDGKPLPIPAALCLLPASILADAALNIWQDQPEVGVALLRRLEEGRDDVVRSPWQYPARVAGRQGDKETRRQGDKRIGDGEQEEGSGQSEAEANFPAASLAASADWNLLYALQGFALDMNTGQMTLAPNIPGLWRTFNAPIFAPTFWGQVEYRPTAHGGITSFRLDRLIGFVTTPSAGLLRSRAELTLKTLRVLSPPRLVNNTVPTRFAAYVSVGQKPIGCRAAQDAEGYITLAFDSPLALTAGDRLEVDVH